MPPFLWLFITCAALVDCAFAFDDVEIKRVSQSKTWHRLMHYHRSFPFYPLRSELDGSAFFFAPDGHKNPEAELRANLDAFLNPGDRKIGKLKQSPQCAYPARFEFLTKELNLKIPKETCVKLDEYLGKFRAESATLVFSSAYPNNPGSMFGHTFLRINSKPKSDQQKTKMDLLDYGLSYAAAVADDENPFVFMAFGLAGGYMGQFSVQPYYEKVNEYVHGESRDLWEYKLSLNESETTTLLKHAWELETNSYFQYYFFDENCAYELLTLIEIAKPEWDVSQFKIYIIPSETIKRLTETPGAVTDIQYRPSLRKKMVHRVGLLTPLEREKLNSLLAFKITPQSVDSPGVVDTAITHLQYLQKQRTGINDEQKKLFRELLVRSSQLPPSPLKDPEPIKKERPDLGHYPFSFGSGFTRLDSRQQSHQSNLDFRFKFAYHDLLNSDVGYIPFSRIDFPAFTLRQDLTNKETRFSEIHLLSLTSLSPWTELEHPLSWQFQFYSKPALDQPDTNRRVWHGEVGSGVSLHPGTNRMITYAMMNLGAEKSSKFGGVGHSGDFRFLPSLELGSVLNFWTPHKVLFSARRSFDILQDERQPFFTEVSAHQSLSFSQHWDARWLNTWLIPQNSSAIRSYNTTLQLNYYFQ